MNVLHVHTYVIHVCTTCGRTYIIHMYHTYQYYRSTYIHVHVLVLVCVHMSKVPGLCVGKIQSPLPQPVNPDIHVFHVKLKKISYAKNLNCYNYYMSRTMLVSNLPQVVRGKMYVMRSFVCTHVYLRLYLQHTDIPVHVCTHTTIQVHMNMNVHVLICMIRMYCTVRVCMWYMYVMYVMCTCVHK